MESSNTITKLCEIAYKYGTDKCPQIKHAYTPYYYSLLSDKRMSIKKILEMGIGHLGPNKKYPRGASLYTWREFFPNAFIYGADNRPKTLIEDERIKTFLCDERKEEDIAQLVQKTGADIDLFIDDASHHVADQIFLAKTILPMLKKEVIYIIEDVGHSRLIRKTLGENYNYEIPDIPRIWHGGMLVVIRNKDYAI